MSGGIPPHYQQQQQQQSGMYGDASGAGAADDDVIDELPERFNPNDAVASFDVEGKLEAMSEAGDDAGGHVEPTIMQGVVGNYSMQFAGHSNGDVFAVSLNPQHPTLALTGGIDDLGLIWDTSTGDIVRQLAGHTDSVVDVAWNFDGSLAATAGLDGTVRAWAPATGECVAVCEGPGDGIEWIKWHPRGNVVLAGSMDHMAWMWNIAPNNQSALMASFSGHSGPVNAGAFFGEGAKQICTVSEDATLRVWNPRSGACLLTVSGHGFHEAGIVSVDVHSSVNVAATGGRDNTARLCNLDTGKSLGTILHPEFVECALFQPGGLPFLATGCGDGGVRIWDTNTLQQRQQFSHETGFAVIKMLWGPDHTLLFTGSTDGTVRVWDPRVGESSVSVLRGHRDAILDFAINPQGTEIVSVSQDGTALVFRANTAAALGDTPATATATATASS